MLVFFDVIISLGFTLRWLLRLSTATVFVLTLLTHSSPVFAYGIDECAASRYGSNIGCTAADVSITGISVAPGTPKACIGGTTFTANVDVEVNFATPDRFDVGIFLSQDGKDPTRLPVNSGANACSVAILPTTTPFYDLDPNGGLDTCGDGNSTIGGGTGKAVVSLTDVEVACQAIPFSGGNLYIPFVVSWDNQASPTGADCTSISDPVPGTTSKCNAPKTTVAAEVLLGTVDAIVLPKITKTDGVTAVNPGQAVIYKVVITNTTGQPLINVATFNDPATANLTINNVTCTATGGAVCPPAPISVAAMQAPPGLPITNMPISSALTFTLTGTVANPVVPAFSNTITNTANVKVTRGTASATNSATDIDNIIGAVYSDLSTSTKRVVDRNGGEADPGDILRYTITLFETAGLAVNGVSVTDDIPTYVNTFTVISTPAGATNSSTGAGTGTNGTGYLNVTGINLPANGTATIVFDVTIAAGTPAGSTINNLATVNNPTGPDGTPSAQTVTVSPSAVPRTDNKKLYIYGGTAPNSMSRNQPAAAPDTSPVVVAQGASVTWNGNNPLPLQLDNTIANTYVSLFLTASSTNTRKIDARLYCSSTPSAYASTSSSYSLNIPSATVPTQYNFNLTSLNGGFAYPATCTSSNYWVLRVDNVSSGNGRDFNVLPTSGADYSRVNLDSSNVIYVENLEFFDAAYSGGSTVSSVAPGTMIYIRSTVSDPFGSFDISSAVIDINASSGTPMVSAASMTEIVLERTAATKTFEYPYTVPLGATAGNWVVKVTANEGTEGTVTDDQTSSFGVFSSPALTFIKSLQTLSDPIKGDINPYNIPGAEILYSLNVTNTGAGSPDADTLVITDQVPSGTALFVGDLVGIPAGSPVLFIDGAGPKTSGLDLGFTNLTDIADGVNFSNDGGLSYGYNPGPDADADNFNSAVTHVKIDLSGTMNASDGINHPEATLRFKVRID